MSKVVKAISGPVLGLITGGVKGLVRGIGNAVTAFVGGPVAAIFAIATVLLTPRAKQQQRQASITSLNLGEVPRQAIFGQAMTAGSLVDAFNYGGKYGTDWEVVILSIADHECAALVGFYVNDKYVVFGGDGAVAGYNGQLAVYWRSGTETQALPSIVTTYGLGWTAASNGAGTAFVVVAYKADAADAKSPVWPAGRPSFAWVVKGAKCYIARKDSTVPGGSGTHRRDNPATWEWTDNPIDCRYAWVRGIYACNRVTQPEMLLIGRGLSAAEAPPENTFAPANLCDEIVAGEPRYRIGGVISAEEEYLTTEEMFAAAMGGAIIQPEGSVEIEPGQAKSPVAYITDADLLVGSAVDYSDFLSEADDEWANTIIPRYVEPAQRWADHAAPIRRVYDDVIADGGPRESTLSMGLVTRATQAGRVGEIARRLGRLWKRGGFTLGPRFCELEEGDWIVWTSQRYLKGASVPFQITAYNLDEKWHNTLRLREINATVYSDGAFIADSSTALGQDAPPAIGAPGVLAWSLSAAQLTSGGQSLPALVIIGAVDDVYAQAVRFEYWRDDGVTVPTAVTDWSGATMAGPGVTRREITSVAPGASYYAAVSYVVNGVPGDRRILGPVTAGAIGGIEGTYAWTPVFDPAKWRREGGNLISLTASSNHIADALTSAEILPGMTVSWSLSNPITVGMLGLDDGTDSYRFYTHTAGNLLIYKNRERPGEATIASVGPYVAGERLTIAHKGTYLQFLRGGTEVHRVTVLPTSKWQLSALTIELGARFDNVAVSVSGDVGADGLSIAELTAYKRAASAPATPSGGSYDFGTKVLTPPSGWSVTIPAGTDPCYATTGVASVQGVTGTATPSWLGVGKAFQDGASGADGQAVNAVFRRSAAQPATPAASAGVPSGWYDATGSVPAGADAIWVSFGTRPDPSSNYSWQTPKRVEGQDGANGLTPDIRFMVSDTKPATPTGDNPAGWVDGMPAGAARKWMSVAQRLNGVVVGTWSEPEQISDLVAKGMYAAGATYQPLDWVNFGGGSYVATATTTGHAPSGTDQANAYWDVLAAPGSPGEPAIPPSAFIATINLTSGAGINLRTLAEGAGYTGMSDATVNFVVPNGVTVRGLSGGGKGIDTGTWPSGSYTVTLTLTVQSGGVVDGGGGNGNSGAGGDAIYCQEAIGVTINSGGIVRGAGGGGGQGGSFSSGGSAADREQVGGGGGGGGMPNGAAGAARGNINVTGTNPTNGNAGTTSAGGTGGAGGIVSGLATGGAGGAGGGYGTAGSTGGNPTTTGAAGNNGLAGGAAGYAVRKNGRTVPVSNSGTMTGTAA